MKNPLTIQNLRDQTSLCMLRDAQGNPMGTGSRETLEVLTFITEQAEQWQRSRQSPSVVATPRPVANIRSALIF